MLKCVRLRGSPRRGWCVSAHLAPLRELGPCAARAARPAAPRSKRHIRSYVSVQNDTFYAGVRVSEVGSQCVWGESSHKTRTLSVLALACASGRKDGPTTSPSADCQPQSEGTSFMLITALRPCPFSRRRVPSPHNRKLGSTMSSSSHSLTLQHLSLAPSTRMTLSETEVKSRLLRCRQSILSAQTSGTVECMPMARTAESSELSSNRGSPVCAQTILTPPPLSETCFRRHAQACGRRSGSSPPRPNSTTAPSSCAWPSPPTRRAEARRCSAARCASPTRAATRGLLRAHIHPCREVPRAASYGGRSSGAAP